MKSLLFFCFLCFNLVVFSQNGARVKKPGADSLSKVAHTAINKQFAKDSLLHTQLVEQARKRTTDSLSLVLQSDLQLTKEKAGAVLAIINQSVSDMDNNAKNQEIKGEEKINRFKAIAKERDERIAALLSESQVQKLRNIMLRSRQNSGR